MTPKSTLYGKSDREKSRRTQRDYTLGFKLQAVAEVERGDMTYKKAQKKYSIQGRSTILVWLRKYGKQIMGHHLARDFKAEGPLQTLRIAIGNRKHTTRSSTTPTGYCSHDYQQVLSKAGIRPSITERYSPTRMRWPSRSMVS